MPEVLPEEFEKRMRNILGSEYEAFAQSLNEERVQGLRFNTLKAGFDEEKDSFISEFGLNPVPWCHEGFTYAPDMRPGRHPCHDAGVYYIQEPSAMAAVELMDPRPGEKVLDLCAAPGGKSTQIAGKLMGKGLLISNEIHPARAKILSQNIERMGIKNAVVLNDDPGTLSEHFPDFFDKILVDVPCSGEGLFRRDEGAIAQWSVENVKYCAKRGQEIMDRAAAMLRPGGFLLYSTCTFETEEDEGAVEAFLERHKDFMLAGDTDIPGFSLFDNCTLQRNGKNGAMYRLWPHKIDGEGHFIALLKRSEEAAPARKRRKDKGPVYLKDRELISLAEKELEDVFRDDLFTGLVSGGMILTGWNLYAVPEGCPSLDGLNVQRCGLCLGRVGKNTFEPSHALALSIKASDSRRVISLGSDGEKINQYLKGSTLPIDNIDKGWVLVCAGQYSLGWGKAVNGVLKNHYPKGLRHDH